MLSLIPAALLALVLSYNVTKEDVRRLLNAGVSEQTIVEFIHRNSPAEPLSVEDMTELKAAGATDAVLKAMLEASRTSETVTPSSSYSPSDSDAYPSASYSYSYPQYYYYPYYTPYYSYSYPYYYPYYSYYRPYSYYRYPYRYPYYQNYNYGRSYPYSVSPYRNQHPQQQPLRPQQQMQPVRPQQQMQPRPQPTQPRHGTGTYRR